MSQTEVAPPEGGWAGLGLLVLGSCALHPGTAGAGLERFLSPPGTSSWWSAQALNRARNGAGLPAQWSKRVPAGTVHEPSQGPRSVELQLNAVPSQPGSITRSRPCLPAFT